MKKNALLIVFVCGINFLFSQNFDALLNENGKTVSVFSPPRVAVFLEKNSIFNAQNKKIEGYRINIYSETGSEARDGAYAAKSRFDTIFPTIHSYFGFKEPYFKIDVGNWTDKLTAVRYLATIRQRYPQAFLVKDFLDIDDYLDNQ
ncbi:MAG: hypothetical protein LBC89_05215 [Bacteroidales bacterium]|jgi:hypothetical protein|nr:hypothetical protein [Bacteroidales bacterium]